MPAAATCIVKSAHMPVTHRDHMLLVQPLEPSQVDELKSSLGAQPLFVTAWAALCPINVFLEVFCTTLVRNFKG